jgi:hypothetical protein
MGQGAAGHHARQRASPVMRKASIYEVYLDTCSSDTTYIELRLMLVHCVGDFPAERINASVSRITYLFVGSFQRLERCIDVQDSAMRCAFALASRATRSISPMNPFCFSPVKLRGWSTLTSTSVSSGYSKTTIEPPRPVYLGGGFVFRGSVSARRDGRPVCRTYADREISGAAS